MDEARYFRKLDKRKAHTLAKRGAAEREANSRTRQQAAARALTMPAPKPRSSN